MRIVPTGIHPGAWLVWAGCAGIATITTTNPFYLLPLFGAAWLVYSACRTEGPSARSFHIFVLFALWAMTIRTALVFFGPMTQSGVAAAALEGLRLGVLLTIFGTFNSVADPFRVLRLAPRRWHEPALAAALALSIAPRTIASVERVREAQRLRGIDLARWRSLPALAVPVLASGMDDAVTLAESMDARGHGRGRRTRYRPEPWTPASVLVVLIGASGAGAFVTAALRGWGDVVPSTFPLAWPEAAPLLLGAAIAFALPAVVGSEDRR